MVAVVACPQPVLQFFDNNGNPAVGGSLLTTVGGVNFPAYSDSAGLVPLPNPIPLNSRGEVSTQAGATSQLFLVPNTVYTFALFDGPNASGNQLWSEPYINGVQVAQLTGEQIAVLLNAVTDNPFIGAYDQSAQESAANIVPINYNYPADGTGMLNVMRYMNTAQIVDVLAGTATQDVSAVIQKANDYLEGRANNSIASLSSLVGGSGYGSASYPNVNLTGGHGAIASANITVAGGIVTVCTLVDMGNNYQVGDVLSASNTQLGGSGSGFSITVASLRANGGGKQVMLGGKLFFPGGRYYCGTTGLRIGDMVEWIGNQFSSTRLAWNSAFTGNCVTIGPDESGFNGRSGLYAFGSVIDDIAVECPLNAAWGIYTTGAQQNVTIRNLWVYYQNGSGIFLQDHNGSTSITVENVYIVPSDAGPIGASVVGIHCDGPACIKLLRVSMNGTTTTPMLRGVEYVGGGLHIEDFECELCVTHIDVSGSAGQNPLTIDHAEFNLAVGGVRGIWIHSGWTGTINAINIDCGPFGVMVQNDITGEAHTASSTGGIMDYRWSGTATDFSIQQNILVIPKLTPVNPPANTVLNVINSSSFDITVANNSAFTIAPPAMDSAAMPATGRTGQRLLIKVINASGGAMGAITWDAVFKKSTFTNPANANYRTIEFEWNGTNWRQIGIAGVDVPN